MLSGLFGKLSPVKSRKKARNLADEMDAAEDEEEASVVKESDHEYSGSSFNAVDRAFLQELVGGMGQVMDSKIQQSQQETRTEIQKLADTVESLKKENKEMSTKLDALEKGAKPLDVQAIKTEVINELKIAPPPGLSSQVSDMASTAPSQSQSDALTYVMGGLGFDDRPELIRQRCLEVLQRYQLSEADFFDIYVPFEFSSSANLVFCDPRRAQLLAMQLRGAKITFSKHSVTGKPVYAWCAIKKSKAERRPINYVKVLGAVVTEQLHADGIEPGKWIVCGASKSIFYESKQRQLGKLGRDGIWSWSNFAKQTFAEQALSACLAAVNSRLA